MAILKSIQFLRNSALVVDKTAAIAELKKQTNTIDGTPVIVRYGEDGTKAILGVAYKPASATEVKYAYVDLASGANETEVQNKLTELENAITVLNGADTVDGSVKNSIKKAIEALDVEDSPVDGEFVTKVSETDGKIQVERGKIAADKVTATAIDADADTIAVTGTTVAAQIASLGKAMKAEKDATVKYEVVKLTDDEVSTLSDAANVKEAYKVVSYVGDEHTAIKTQVGETIKIYKDASLESVTTTGEENTVIKFVYSLANGTKQTVEVDLGKAIFESEMGNGMQITDSKIAIKLDAANEGEFLTVGEGGLKLSGVQTAIDTAVAAKNVSAEGDDYITATAADNKVTVKADVQGLTVTTAAGHDSTIAGVEKSLVDGKEVADKVGSFVNARIGEEIAKLDATVGEAAVAVGKHIAVQVIETDGKITAVNVKESNIASDSEVVKSVNGVTGNAVTINGTHIKWSNAADSTTVKDKIDDIVSKFDALSTGKSIEKIGGKLEVKLGTELATALEVKEGGLDWKNGAVIDCGTF